MSGDIIEEKGAIVEVRTAPLSEGVSYRILVNGTDVGLVEDGWHIDYERGVKRITLTLLCREIIVS